MMIHTAGRVIPRPGELLKIEVLETKDKQRPGREVWLCLYPEMTVTRGGEQVAAADLKPDDIIRYLGEGLRVVSVETWR